MKKIGLVVGALACAPIAAHAESLAAGITDLDLSSYVTGLTQPTAAAFLPDDRLVIIQKEGGIKVRPAGGGNLINAGTFSVETTSEQGLIGFAVDPEFATTNRLYFYISQRGSPVTNRHRIVYTTIDPVTSVVDVAQKVEILAGLYGPANHDGGGMTFGPDGNLYIGVGDTGCNCGCAPGQADNYFPTCLTNFNGKILRITREGDAPADAMLSGDVPACGVPGSNYCATGPNAVPNASNVAPAKAEIYNWGFRNPWRFVFDEQTGFLWIGDVGEITWEEVTISTGPNQHHGWPFREGFHGQAATACANSTPQSGNCREPAFEYNHNETPTAGQGSISAGAFSNHCSWPEPWRGRFWFGDYNKSRVWTLTPNAARDGVETGSRTNVVTGASGPVHFFNGPDGAVYFVAIGGGDIWRIAPRTPANCNPDDAGTPEVDAGGMDATTSPDALAVDLGTPTPDTGAAPVDSGAAPADSGTPLDASAPDSGTPVVDAGSVADAGTIEEADDDCGCNSTQKRSSSILGLLAALTPLALRRRRR